VATKYIDFLEILLEKGQHIIVHEKSTLFLRSMPTIEKVCPWDSFIVRENDIFTGNCKFLKDIGKSVGIIGICGM